MADLDLVGTSEVPDLSDMTFDERVEAIVDWFHENFEDPAQETPYDGREGGYQYIWGGPYEATDELNDAFDYEEYGAEIEAAVGEIESDGLTDWAPNGSRIREIENDGQVDLNPPPLEERLAKFRGELDELEGFVNAWRGRGMMGHNGPPEEAQLHISGTELDEAQECIDAVRAELDKPNAIDAATPESLTKAESRFRSIAKKLWLAIKVGAGAVALGATKEVGKELMEDPHAFAMKLEHAAGTIAAWVVHLYNVF